MSKYDQTIAVRALNYLRGTHFPTYVGLRFLLNQLPRLEDSSAVSRLVQQHALSGYPRLYSMYRFKKFDEMGGSVFRDYSVPSPTHALIESYALSILDRHGLREKPSFVYSYLPPTSSDYNRNFLHFSEGYRRRNRDVLSALASDRTAIVLDLKNFYPSLNARKVVEDYLAWLAKAPISVRDLQIIRKCVESCIQFADAEVPGLRVGPEFSHVLADFALGPLDAALSAAFPNSYFRYVDDLVVVAHCEEVDSTFATISALVQGRGFELNASKTEFAKIGEWEGSRATISSDNAGVDQLSRFKFRLKVFLSRNPGLKGEIGRRLTALGIHLPLDQMMDAVRSPVWSQRLAHFWRVGWAVVLRFRLDSIETIVLEALACQRLVRSELAQIEQVAKTPMSLSRRWLLQRARFIVNRSLYFLPGNELASIVPVIDDVPELVETRAVLKAVGNGDFTEVVRMPGPALAAAAQISAIRGIDVSVVPVNVLGNPSSVTTEVFSTFAIRGLRVDDPLGIDLEDDSAFAALVRFATSRSRAPHNFDVVGYGEELDALGAGVTEVERLRMASRRLEQGEEVMFDGLLLGSEYAS